MFVRPGKSPEGSVNVTRHGDTLIGLLAKVAREALFADSLEPLLHRICDFIVRELPVSVASIMLLDEQNTRFVHEVWAGEPGLLPPPPIHVWPGVWPVTMGASGRCARSGTPQLIENVNDDADFVMGNSAVCSAYLVPIRHPLRLHGVLNIETTRSNFFDREACAMFDAVADQIAGAIHFARVADDLATANRKLEQMSMLDGLTGIANRRRFDRHLSAEWARLAREGRSLALLMMDADAFKALNDSGGHLYGDECLRELARCAEAVTESGDLAARFGGEELAVLLPGRDIDAAAQIGEHLRGAVEARAMAHPASPVSPLVTVSIGVSAVVPDPACSPERLIEGADRALYSAKREGRNRVRVADI